MEFKSFPKSPLGEKIEGLPSLISEEMAFLKTPSMVRSHGILGMNAFTPLAAMFYAMAAP
jgi:hypothetical protein